jgi:hypothetical protein
MIKLDRTSQIAVALVLVSSIVASVYSGVFAEARTVPGEWTAASNLSVVAPALPANLWVTGATGSMKRPPWTGTSLTSGSQRDITAAWLNRIKGSSPTDNADKAAGGTTGVASAGNVKSFAVKTVNNSNAEIPAMLVFKKIYEDMQLGFERSKAEIKEAMTKLNANQPYEGLDWSDILRTNRNLRFMHVPSGKSLLTEGGSRYMKFEAGGLGEIVQLHNY